MMAASAYRPAPVRGPSGLLFGVCADLAYRAGMPVWMPRTVFVVGGLMHFWLAVVIYGVFAYAKRHAIRTNGIGARTVWREAPTAASGLRDKFGSLDRRLSDLEAATSSEWELRRQFRDMR